MKLFQQLLVAPAAVGFLATGASAADLNINGVSDYADDSVSGLEQVTSITQFSDVYPTDWAYQALSNLVERYGCVAGYPNGTFRGNRAMTRYEAAALLNACLDRITEITDELRRLIKEFETELAIIRGRVDGLEARVGELEATQFSTTTKLEGQATFDIGGNQFYGNRKYRKGKLRNMRHGKAEALFGDDSLYASGPNKKKVGYKNYARTNFGATSFNYDLQMQLNTSFTGKDMLTTLLRSGNFGETAFDGQPTNLSALEVASASGNEVYVDKIFYSFPVGEGFTVFVGANVGQDDMLPMWPSAYVGDPSETVLDVNTLNGAPVAYNKNQGAGAGINWESESGFKVGLNYVAAKGNSGDPVDGGFLTDGAAGTGTVQIGYEADQWGLAAIYSYVQDPGETGPYSTLHTAWSYDTDLNDNPNAVNAFGLSGFWRPEDSGWIPSISLGWGYNKTSFDGKHNPGSLVKESQSWLAALQWDDLFMEGNSAGLAVGEPTFATELKSGKTPFDGNYAWEWWYKFQVTDNIAITPSMFYLSRPLGQFTKGKQFSQLGGVLRTTFNF